MKTIIFLLKEILSTAQSIEAKLDVLLNRQKNQNAPINPMHYSGQVDPLSQQPIQWLPVNLEDGSQVLIRHSGNTPKTNELPLTLGKEI